MARLRIVAALVTVAALAACVSPRTPRPAPFAAPEKIKVRSNGRVQAVPIEDYVLASMLSEHTPLGADDATVARIFDVQAVVARTYAVAHLGRHQKEGFDLCDATHCQLYEPDRIRTSRFVEPARRAAERTRGVVLVYQRQPVEALYHSDCGGHTASAEEVWGNIHVPYLTGAPDDVPALKHRTWRFDVAADRLRSVLNQDERSDVGRNLDRIVVTSRDSSGRAARVQVRGSQPRVLRGEDLRAVLNQAFGDRAIMSTRFSVTRAGNSYRFEGTGFGHGVGLCQTGAAARAARGDDMAAVFSAYFPGAALTKVSASLRPDANISGDGPLALLRSP